jgi:hypothetical protein
MEDKGKITMQDSQVEQLLNNFLRSGVSSSNSATTGQHLDEDTFAAFVEGNLTERETQPVLSHLVDCSFCRHVSAELVKLDYAFVDEKVESVVLRNEPSKVSEVLNNLLSRIFGTNDSVVFAHQETKDDSEKIETSEDNKN